MKIQTRTNFYNALELLVKVLNDHYKDDLLAAIENLIDAYNAAGNQRVQLNFDGTFNMYSLEEF